MIARLREEVDKKGISQVAKELGVSKTTVYLVLQGKYKSMERLMARIQAIYGAKGILCPVLGEITPDICSQKWELAKVIGLKAGNPETLKLYKACQKCALRK